MMIVSTHTHRLLTGIVYLYCARILIYDRLWLIQVQRAQLLQKHHPHLEIMSYRDFMNLIKHKGANRINQQYDVVSTLGLWSAERFIQRNVHVHSSVVGSYSYVAK